MTAFTSIFPLTNLSKSECADYLGVSERFVQRMINGQAEAFPDMIERLKELRQAIELVAEGHEIELPYASSEKEAVRETLRLQRQKERATT